MSHLTIAELSTPMSHLTIAELLCTSGFTEAFSQSVVRVAGVSLDARGAVVVIDQANVLRLVLEDFARRGRDVQSLSYTDLSAETLSEEDEVKDDRQTCTVGPGVHKHETEADLFFCYENEHEPSSGLHSLHSNVHRFTNRAALIHRQGDLLGIKKYLAELQRKKDAEDKVRMYYCCEGQWLERKIPLRSPDTLFLGKLWSEIETDAREFFDPDNVSFYRQHGIPWVRSYMFEGPPGNGKSSAIRVLASLLKLRVYVLNLNMATLDDAGMTSLLTDVPPRSMVVIEDIDRVLGHHGENESPSHISQAGLLNMLDGTLVREGILFVLTANETEFMTPAFQREGRLDRIFKFQNPDGAAVAGIFGSYYPESTRGAAFAKKVLEEKDLPMSAVQEYLIRKRKETDQVAVAKVKSDLTKRRRRDKLAYENMCM